MIAKDQLPSTITNIETSKENLSVDIKWVLWCCRLQAVTLLSSDPIDRVCKLIYNCCK